MRRRHDPKYPWAARQVQVQVEAWVLAMYQVFESVSYDTTMDIPFSHDFKNHRRIYLLGVIRCHRCSRTRHDERCPG